MNIIIANGPGRLDNGLDVILFPSRWDSAVPRAPFRFYPYELATLSTLLKRELPDANVKMLDGNIKQWGATVYAYEIRQHNPDVLICECSALTYSTMTRVMQLVQPERAILCGPMAGYDASRAYQDGWTDAVVGEYELQVLELLGGTAPDEARTDAGLVNLDWLPWPEDKDIDRGAYREINHYIDYQSNAVVPQMYLSRGCPLSCNFCVVPTYYGGHGRSHRSHRCRDVEDCCEEILYLRAMYGDRMKAIYANEEAHNANVPWLVELCEAFIRHGMKDRHGLHFDAMTGYWAYTKELVELMARAGYKQLRFGVESTSQQVGKNIGKTIHLEKMETFMRWCREYGIFCYGTFMIGAPGSTKEIDLQTLEDLRRWKREGLMQKWQVSTSVPQPGVPFHKLAKENGWLVTEDINKYDGWNAVVSYPHYSSEDILAVRMTAP